MKIIGLSFDFALRQLSRLSGLRGFHRDDKEVCADLIKALMTAPNEPAAEAFIDRWIRENVFAPQPADIYEAFSPPTEYWRPPPEENQCSICGDTGWKPVERGGYSAVVECECKKIRLVPKKNGA